MIYVCLMYFYELLFCFIFFLGPLLLLQPKQKQQCLNVFIDTIRQQLLSS